MMTLNNLTWAEKIEVAEKIDFSIGKIFKKSVSTMNGSYVKIAKIKSIDGFLVNFCELISDGDSEKWVNRCENKAYFLNYNN